MVPVKAYNDFSRPLVKKRVVWLNRNHFCSVWTHFYHNAFMRSCTRGLMIPHDRSVVELLLQGVATWIQSTLQAELSGRSIKIRHITPQLYTWGQTRDAMSTLFVNWNNLCGFSFLVYATFRTTVLTKKNCFVHTLMQVQTHQRTCIYKAAGGGNKWVSAPTPVPEWQGSCPRAMHFPVPWWFASRQPNSEALRLSRTSSGTRASRSVSHAIFLCWARNPCSYVRVYHGGRLRENLK